MSALRISCLFLLCATTLSYADPKVDAEVDKRLAAGLILIRDGKFDQWIVEHCSPGKLCVDESSRKSVKANTLPVVRQRAGKCIREQGKIEVKKREGTDTEVKVFVQCEETAMPIPFTMVRENGHWMFGGL